MRLKRLVPTLLALLLLLSGCQVKNYTPELPSAFTQKATVTSGDFSFECEICRNSDDVRVTVMSTQAKGMVMTYDGEQLEFVYGGYAHSVNGDGFERVNTAVVIYETMEYLETQPQTESKKNGIRL